MVVLDGEPAVPCTRNPLQRDRIPARGLALSGTVFCASVMNTGSCAAEDYESRQVREEAAVNRIFWVPQENLVGAGSSDKPVRVDRQWVHGLSYENFQVPN